MTHEESQMVRDLHDALLRVPPGSPSDDRPLLEEIRLVVRAYRRGSWIAKVVVWGAPVIVSAVIGWEKIYNWLVR
ncbi:hypothetical protein [uncultured Roseobacter sp.]|uniref:hypothetical protein n=1 Tax=uncultured Roseobacter sp. TaxID=114847 RepID=UPI0026207097|nr:hypothetical protein [uncultured Roseobacter sp.]